MPLKRLLNGSTFGPKKMAILAAAYEIALRSLSLVDRNDPITEIVAKKVIEVAQNGLRDPAQIAAQAIKELGIS